MGRSKRGVRFPHSNGQASGSEGRRSSFSDASEDGGASPTRTRRVHAQLAPVQEVGQDVAARLEVSKEQTSADQILLLETTYPRRGISKKEGQLHHANLLDSLHAGSLLYRPLRRSYLHHHHRHHSSNRFIQRGHCHCQRPKPSPVSSVYQEPQLVLVGYHHVLPLR